jgi:hypothetical protein
MFNPSADFAAIFIRALTSMLAFARGSFVGGLESLYQPVVARYIALSVN